MFSESSDRELDAIFGPVKTKEQKALERVIQAKRGNLIAIAKQHQQQTIKQARKYGKI